jgi:hypothetical protein
VSSTGRGKIRPTSTWPEALRWVRGWLTLWIWLQRWWRAWSREPPPPELQALLDWLVQGNRSPPMTPPDVCPSTKDQ